jgi:hypothetical protein
MLAISIRLTEVMVDLETELHQIFRFDSIVTLHCIKLWCFN